MERKMNVSGTRTRESSRMSNITVVLITDATFAYSYIAASVDECEMTAISLTARENCTIEMDWTLVMCFRTSKHGSGLSESPKG